MRSFIIAPVSEWTCSLQLIVWLTAVKGSLIAINPLIKIINKTGYGYCLWNSAIISHLLYIDDTKLYARSDQDINLLMHTTRIYSNDIGMSFGLEKWCHIITKRGKVVSTEGIVLPEGNLADIEDSYKHLGIQQENRNREEATREVATTHISDRSGLDLV